MGSGRLAGAEKAGFRALKVGNGTWLEHKRGIFSHWREVHRRPANSTFFVSPYSTLCPLVVPSVEP